MQSAICFLRPNSDCFILLTNCNYLAVEGKKPKNSAYPQTPHIFLSTGDDSMRMSHLKVGSAADIPLDIGELDLSQLTATLTTPSGREEPCLLKMLRNGHVGKCSNTATSHVHVKHEVCSCANQRPPFFF